MMSKRTNLILLAFVLCAAITFVRSLDAADVLISGVPAYLQNNFSGTQDCAPVASAMVLGYWDGFGYDKLVDAVGAGDGSSSWATNPGGVTALVDDLKVAEGWVTGVGTTGSIPDGIQDVANHLDYENEYSFMAENTPYTFSWVQTEIDAGRPLLLTTYSHPIYGNHTMAVVGYDDTNSKPIVHDNWSETPVYLNMVKDDSTSVNGSLTIIWQGPSGSAPAAPTLVSPSGPTVPSLKPTLTWDVPNDDYGGFLHFKVEIDTVIAFDSGDYASYESKSDTTGFSDVPATAGTGTASYTFQAELTNGETYYWRVSAWDGQFYGSTSDVWQFTIEAKTWDGGGADGNWSTATNWNGDVVPTDADDVVIPYVAGSTIVVDASADVDMLNSLIINASAADGEDITLQIDKAMGDATAFPFQINIGGAGDVTITGDAVALNVTTLDINHTGSTGTLGCSGIGTTTVTGAITVDTSASDAAGNITINRSGAWTAGSTTALTAATSAGSITMTLGAASTFAGGVTLTAGTGTGNVTLDLGTTNQDFNGDLILVNEGSNGGTPQLDLGSGLHTLAGLLTNVAIGVLTTGDSTLIFDGDTDKTLTSSGGSFYNLTLDKDAAANTLTLQDDLDVDGKLTIIRGNLALGNNLEHHFAGDFEIQTDGAITKGTGTTILIFDGITYLTDNSSGGPQNLGAVKVE